MEDFNELRSLLFDRTGRAFLIEELDSLNSYKLLTDIHIDNLKKLVEVSELGAVQYLRLLMTDDLGTYAYWYIDMVFFRGVDGRIVSEEIEKAYVAKKFRASSAENQTKID